MVAGEASGDLLAGSLLAGLRARWPRLVRRGHRRAAHGRARLRRLVAARQARGARLLSRCCGHFREIARHPEPRWSSACCADKPDAFIGVDAPDFNLGLETQLKAAGVQDDPLRQPVDLGLARRARREHRPRRRPWCSASFRSSREIYAKHGIAATYVGHPLADAIPLELPRAAGRAALGPRRRRRRVVALLPGSRRSEIELHRAAPVRRRGAMQRAAAGPALRRSRWSPGLRDAVERAARQHAPDARDRRCSTAGRTRRSPPATSPLSPAARRRSRRRCSSGRWSSPTRCTASAGRSCKRMHYQPWVGLPNILLREFAVPELLQGDATPAKIAAARRSSGSTIPARLRVAARPLRGNPPGAEARHWRTRHRCDRVRSRAEPHARQDFLRAAKLRGIVDVAGLMAGVDEAGRGPLAGPVVAAAVILDENRTIRGLRRLEAADAPRQRERLTARSARSALSLQRRARRASRRSTRLNILHAALLAMRRAVEGLAQQPQIVLVDGNQRAAAGDAGAHRRRRRRQGARRSRRRRSSPRCTATGSACSCTRSIRSTASTATRATRRPST